MRKFIGAVTTSISVFALPLVASAQGDQVSVFLGNVRIWVGTVVGIVLVLAVLVFFWGLVKYISAVGEEKHNGLLIMFYGILTIFVMVALWGLVAFFGQNLIPGYQNKTAPQFNLPAQPQYGTGQ